MNEKTMRTFEFNGKKRGIRLDAATWQTIDWLASQRGVKWFALAREWAVMAGHTKQVGTDTNGENLTGVIREAAMQELMNATILSERAEMIESAGPIWQSLGMCNDEILTDAMKSADSIEGLEDFVGFKLTAGVSEFGKVTYYIENNIKDCPNVIISTPFTPEQWEAAQ